MHLVVTGGTGFLGRPLVEHFVALGYECTVLTREPRRAATCGLPHGVKFARLTELPAADAIIHLAGESIVGLWTARKRRAILASRVDGTRRLITALRTAKNRPHTLLSASAVGFYGNRPGEALEESCLADPQQSFRAEVCRQWEEVASEADRLGIRVVNLRIGNVMDPAGGYLAGILPLYRALGGFVIGHADAVIPWISRVDCIRLIAFALANERWYGPLNITHPEPLTHRHFTHTVAQAVHRTSLGRIPSGLLRLALGEFAGALLDDQRVIPAKALAAGFTFAHSSWDKFLRGSFGHQVTPDCQPAPAR